VDGDNYYRDLAEARAHALDILALYIGPAGEAEIRHMLGVARRQGWSTREYEDALAAIRSAREVRAQQELPLAPARPEARAA